MNIAVIFTKDTSEGGAFQYAVSIALLLKKNISDKYNFIFYTTRKSNMNILKKYGLAPVYLRWSNFDRFKSFLFNSQLMANVFSKVNMRLEPKLDRIFKRHNIDLVHFLAPADLAMALSFHNYIFTVWDLCFLDSMEFPEVYANREFERRESLYRLAIIKAVAVITDSEFTKRNIVKRYGVKEERVISLPFLPSNAVSVSEQTYNRGFIDIAKKYNIDGKYIFYPAQFWAHKNHVYILNGLKLLKEKYKTIIRAVFSGSDKGNLSFVLRRVKELGLTDQVHYIGFVDDKELPYLYRQALALVMPTYFSPTNIPPLEAFILGCPVMYSDLPGLREQVEGSAILLDLNNPDSMCKGVIKIIERSPEINTMIENGKRKIESLLIEDRWSALKAVFDDYLTKSRCWKRG